MGSQINFAIFAQKGSFAQNCYHFSLKSTRKLNQPAQLSNNELYGIQILKLCSAVTRISCYNNCNDKKFLFTGPLPKTVVDFWRLIWQERPPIIVMVTNVKEGGKIKCQQYWPESGKKDFGPFQVTITDQQIFADYTIRILSVSVNFS